MTLDELVKIADIAETELEWVLKVGDGQRAGIAAVVRAISDRLRATDHAELWAAANVIDEILGPDLSGPGEKVVPKEPMIDNAELVMRTVLFLEGEGQIDLSEAIEAMAGELERLKSAIAHQFKIEEDDEAEIAHLKELLGFKTNLTAEMVQLNKERVAAEAERDHLAGEVAWAEVNNRNLACAMSGMRGDMDRLTAERDHLRAALDLIARGTAGSPYAIGIALKALGDA